MLSHDSRLLSRRSNDIHTFAVETFDDNTGFWVPVRTILVVWPLKTVRCFKWIFFLRYTKQVEDVGNHAEIAAARHAAHKTAIAQRGETRIVEVKTNGYQYVIWQRPTTSTTGKWL